jgi:hypothetical protein
MWFLLFNMGALLLGAFGLPAARHLPVAPPPEALLACYFLLAALLRLLVRNVRLAAFERKARREARRKDDRKAPSAIGELGLGVGRGALLAVGGDLLGAGLSLASALLRGAASSVSAPPPPTRERRRAARWEGLKAAACVAGVGLVCAGIAWEPLARTRLRRAASAAVKAATEPPGASQASAPAFVPAPTGGPATIPAATAISTADPTADPTPTASASASATEDAASTSTVDSGSTTPPSQGPSSTPP